jgi:hypothetical protein
MSVVKSGLPPAVSEDSPKENADTTPLPVAPAGDAVTHRAAIARHIAIGRLTSGRLRVAAS